MENFPVEILHRIFDHLDLETLFFSIRILCRYFRSTVFNYDRLNFNFKIISKCHFDVLCRLISPQNIRSLTLYHNKQIPDQISLFFSRIHLRQLTRLHSIHLDGIEEFQLNYLFERIDFNLLQSVTIHLTKHDNRRRKTTTNSLSKIVQQFNLRTMEFRMKNDRLSEIEWPPICSIQCLTVNGDIKFENLAKIFSCSPQLYRLVLKEKFSYLIDSYRLKSSFSQLTSLIVEAIAVTIDQIEGFLSFTPSLIDLKLIGICGVFDGKQWEDFIQANLPHLNRFEFDITCWRSSTQPREDLDLFVQSYRSAFWIEQKKWFILAELNLDNPSLYRVYSLPMCQRLYEYNFNLRKVSVSTSNEICSMEKISQLNLRCEFVSIEDVFSSMNFVLPNLIKLHLYFNGKLPVYCRRYLRKLVDVSQLIEMKFENRRFHDDDEHFLFKLLTCLQKSPKLSSLILHIRYSQHEIYPHLETIIQLLPCHIHQLQIPIKETKHVEMILERCQHLSIGRFPLKRARRSMEIKQWFERNTLGSVHQKYAEFDTIWIGKKNNDKEENFNSKRMKINGDFAENTNS